MWAWVCPFMFFLEVVEWRNESGECGLSVLHGLCSYNEMREHGVTYKEKRQLHTIVLEAQGPDL